MCVRGQCNNFISVDIDVQNVSGYGSLVGLENINPTADCYVVKSDQAIVCNANVHLSCDKVVVLKQTEFFVLDDGNIYDHVTVVYLKIGEYVYVNGTVFRCNMSSHRITRFIKCGALKFCLSFSLLLHVLSRVCC